MSIAIADFDAAPFQRMKYFVELHFANVHVEVCESTRTKRLSVH